MGITTLRVFMNRIWKEWVSNMIAKCWLMPKVSRAFEKLSQPSATELFYSAMEASLPGWHQDMMV